VHPALASRVIDSVKQHFSYRPATRNGQPVATVIAVTVPLVRAVPLEDVLADRSKPGTWRPIPAISAVRQSTDVAWLERLVVSEEAADDAALRGRVGPKQLRVEAYARLGELGSTAGLDALDRINRLARTRRPAAERFSASRWAHPAWHFGDANFAPLADVTVGGTTYAIVPASPYGKTELFVTWSRTPTTPSSWARPRLLNEAFWYVARDARVTVKECVLELSYTQTDPSAGKARETGRPPDGSRHLRVVLADITRDSDGDGWTDLEEERLGLSPSEADTDGDGTADGADVCPNLAAQHADVGEVPEIVQTAFAATFGLSGSLNRILAVHPTARIHFWGYAGPVIYGRSRPSALEAREGVYLEWEVVNRTPDNATVIFEDWEGPLAAGGLNVYLKKMRGKWYVVAVRSTWIS